MKDIKFKLTAESKVNWAGVTLFRIEAIVDIKSRGVKKGDKGGWVESETLPNGNARVFGNAWVSGNAEVSDNAWVSGNAEVSDNAWVSGDAWVSDNAEVSGNARVFDNAWVSDNAEVSGNARVFDNARVSGNAEVSGDAWVSGDARVSGNAEVSGKKAYTKGWFIGGDDTGKITNITDQTGSTYWKAQYVLGDYEIKDLEEKPTDTIKIGGKTYEVTDELKNALDKLKEV